MSIDRESAHTRDHHNGLTDISPHQIYKGYSDEDVAMLRSYVRQRAIVEKDYIVDGFAQTTLLECVPFCSEFNTDRLTLPIPDDGFHAETIEYIALADSVGQEKNDFCAVEVGAGWGPWISLGGVLARSRGVSSIKLIGVEPLPARYELMKRHLSANGFETSSSGSVSARPKTECHLILGTATTKRMKVWFPDVDVRDMGPAVSLVDSQLDYRGVRVKNIQVEGYTLADIIGTTQVDYMHIDIQGTELDLIAQNIDLLSNQVRALMVATHSRVIEGRLIELLYNNGWYLRLEKPCQVNWQAKPVSQPAMTLVDGSQYWKRIE